MLTRRQSEPAAHAGVAAGARARRHPHDHGPPAHPRPHYHGNHGGAGTWPDDITLHHTPQPVTVAEPDGSPIRGQCNFAPGVIVNEAR